MARLNPLSLYPLSFEDALRGLLAVGPAASKVTPAKANQKRQPTTRKAESAKATKKKRKKKEATKAAKKGVDARWSQGGAGPG